MALTQQSALLILAAMNERGARPKKSAQYRGNGNFLGRLIS
jgi:hypothetical protein